MRMDYNTSWKTYLVLLGLAAKVRFSPRNYYSLSTLQYLVDQLVPRHSRSMVIF